MRRKAVTYSILLLSAVVFIVAVMAVRTVSAQTSDPGPVIVLPTTGPTSMPSVTLNGLHIWSWDQMLGWMAGASLVGAAAVVLAKKFFEWYYDVRVFQKEQAKRLDAIETKSEVAAKASIANADAILNINDSMKKSTAVENPDHNVMREVVEAQSNLIRGTGDGTSR